MRIDKFLWAVRLHKTRSKATEACQKDGVRINEHLVKPSAGVKVGDLIAVRRPPIWRQFRVIEIPKSRVGAPLVQALITETTSWEELEKAENARKMKLQHRDKGTGRPTKRERRDMDRFRDA